jgi:2-polyprenyl-3-methyl-5-hydroxy-6-metoxy-1,4-benzoquinol methylase
MPFSEAAPYYRYRAPYAPEALAFVCEAFGLNETSRVLDLGSGPGTIAIPLARAVARVIAVDPSEAMLRAGQVRSAEEGRDNIDWICARAEEVSERLGTFRAVTIGQAFHWMDRDAVLFRLEKMIATGGGIALINPGRRRPQESWENLASEVVARYLGQPTRHRKMNPEPENEPSLLRSNAFSRFACHDFPLHFERDVSSIIGYVYSISTSPKSAFGNRSGAFERELTDALLQNNPTGVFDEKLETEVLLARSDCNRSSRGE